MRAWLKQLLQVLLLFNDKQDKRFNPVILCKTVNNKHVYGGRYERDKIISMHYEFWTSQISPHWIIQVYVGRMTDK